MNKLVKRGFSAYKIFLKNKLVSSIMMLFTGVMMFIAALNGRGNDTKSLPILITSIGTILTLYSAYRIGYIKACLDKISGDDRDGKVIERRVLISQIGETLLYVLVAGLGVFLLSNEGFTNKVLNLMAGGFTTLNGVLGAINTYKNRENKDFRWKFMLVLTVIELVIGPYFIIVSDSIDVAGYTIMGALTTVAGLIEVISALTKENLRGTLDDGKEIVRIMKDGEQEKSKD